MGKLTLEKIAELTGVSRSTVSRVINDHPNVKSEVRERVLKVIAQTGYHSDPITRLQNNHRSNVLGLLIPQSTQAIFTDPYYLHLIQGITQTSNIFDYSLSLFLLHEEKEEDKLYPRILQNQLFDGLITTAIPANHPLILGLLANNIPFVLIGRHENPQISFIDVDNLGGAYTATTHLIRTGHQRIATIVGNIKNTASADRLQGYKNALGDRGYPIDENLIRPGDFTEQSGYEATQKLLPYQPDAIFAASDTMALGALRALREAKITVPNEISVVGFDDLPHAVNANPALTTIRQPVKATGNLAVELLLDILSNEYHPPQRIILPTEFVMRASTSSKTK